MWSLGEGDLRWVSVGVHRGGTKVGYIHGTGSNAPSTHIDGIKGRLAVMGHSHQRIGRLEKSVVKFVQDAGSGEAHKKASQGRDYALCSQPRYVSVLLD